MIIIIAILIFITMISIILVFNSRVKDVESDNKLLTLQLTDCKNTKNQDSSNVLTVEKINEYNDINRLRFLTIKAFVDSQEETNTLFKSYKSSKVPELPTINDLNNSNYVSSISILNLYFIDKLYDNKIQYPNESTFTTSINSLLPSGFILKKILTYTCNSLIIDSDSYGGIVLEYNNVTFIVLKGTTTSCEAFIDLNATLKNPKWISNASVKIHSGINDMYTNSSTTSLREQLKPYIESTTIQNLIITGHSLGSGLGSLLMYDII